MLRHVVAFMTLLAPAAFAEVPEDAARVHIMPGWREADGTHIAGFRVRLAPGWKTYWRAPGDGGIPPIFNWSGSRNLSAANVRFPVPEVFRQNGLRSVGYEDEVIFPIILQSATPTEPIQLRGVVEIGVCEEICVPMQFDVNVNLLVGGKETAALANAMESRPVSVGGMSCDVTPIEDGLRVMATATFPAMGKGEAAIIEAGTPGVWVSEPELTRNGMTVTAVADMVPPTASPFALSRDSVRMTLIGNGQAVEAVGCSG